MKRKNLKVFSIITLLFLLIAINYSYSQWTITGNISNLGNAPSISVVDQNIVWVVGDNTAVEYRTANGGATWTSIPNPGRSTCVWGINSNTVYQGEIISLPDSYFGTTYYGKLKKTTNLGQNWIVIQNVIGSSDYIEINGIAFSKTNPVFGIAVCNPPNGIFTPFLILKTTNGGTNWTETYAPATNAYGNPMNNAVFVIDSLFYGFGLDFSPLRIYYTTNGGISWNLRDLSSLLGTSKFLSGIAFSDNKLDGICASYTSLPNIARTTDGGLTWSIVNVGSDFNYICTCKWIEGTNTCYLSAYEGTGGVIKKSTNAGLNWTTMTTSSIQNIIHMEFRKVGNNVYGFAVTDYGTILKLTDVISDVTTNNSLVPSEFSLSQNYPNPFNPATNLEYGISKLEFVSLKVYEIMGKEVATLVNESKPEGTYSVEWNAANYPSGVYYYKLTAGDFSETRKMMLLK
jgi:photosystem II stability/assembly factor-like uncharacterized protein